MLLSGTLIILDLTPRAKSKTVMVQFLNDCDTDSLFECYFRVTFVLYTTMVRRIKSLRKELCVSYGQASTRSKEKPCIQYHT